MPSFPWAGPTYTYNSSNYDAQRSVNVFPIKSEVGTSKKMTAMQGRPGLQTALTFPTFPPRGGINVNDRNFVVSGNVLYEIFTDSTYISRGTIASASGNVGLAQNGFQVCIVDGPQGWVFTLATNTLTEITDPYFLGARTVAFDSGYFIFVKPDSQIYYISALYDGLNGDPLDFAAAEGSPDNLVAVASVHQQVYLLGQSTTQIVTNTGGADFPYSTVQGALIQYGCLAPFSVIQSANILFWLGSDADGHATIWKAEGYSPVKISTHVVDNIIQAYPELDNCTAYSYQEQGHWFIVFNFTDSISWAYDVEIQQWHERAYFSDGEYSRHRPNFHIFAYGKHLMGDYEDGRLYQQSVNFYTDDGQYIRCLRAMPYIADDLEYLYFSQFQLDMQTGIGLDGGSTIEGGAFDSGFDLGFDIGGEADPSLDPATNPKLVLQWSDDGGHTWSNEHLCAAGKIGQYGVRAIWRRLGRARQRVFRIIMTAPCKVFWICAHIQLQKGTN